MEGEGEREIVRSRGEYMKLFVYLQQVRCSYVHKSNFKNGHPKCQVWMRDKFQLFPEPWKPVSRCQTEVYVKW